MEVGLFWSLDPTGTGHDRGNPADHRQPTSEVIDMSTPKRPDTFGARIERFPAADQRRLDDLMSRHNEGTLAPEELEELKDLVRRAEQLTLRNAQRIDASFP